ncbi:hypothetical protein NXY07_01340 [Phocaeicola dorei]|nr:hypothetical protein [Phocaeicola dorei]
MIYMGALDNRIMKGCEYLSKSNLGYDVPFHVWKDLTGKYSNWQSLGQASMGEFRAVFELPYNHYVERKKMEMPYTKMVLNRIRPEWRPDLPVIIPDSELYCSIWERMRNENEKVG